MAILCLKEQAKWCEITCSRTPREPVAELAGSNIGQDPLSQEQSYLLDLRENSTP